MNGIHNKKLLLIILALITFTVFVYIFVGFNLSRSTNEALPEKPSKIGNQLVKDENNTFSMEIPADWKVTYYNKSGDLLAGVEAKTRDFYISASSKNVNLILPATFSQGAVLTARCVKGDPDQNEKPDTSILSRTGRIKRMTWRVLRLHPRGIHTYSRRTSRNTGRGMRETLLDN